MVNDITMAKKLKYYLQINGKGTIFNLKNYSRITSLLMKHNPIVLANIDMLTKPVKERLIQHVYLDDNEFVRLTFELRKSLPRRTIMNFVQIKIEGIDLMQIRLKE